MYLGHKVYKLFCNVYLFKIQIYHVKKYKKVMGDSYVE